MGDMVLVLWLVLWPPATSLSWYLNRLAFDLPRTQSGFVFNEIVSCGIYAFVAWKLWV